MKNYESFNEWKKDQSLKNKKLINEVSRVISGITPKLKTIVKWGQGCWTDGGDHKFFIHCKPDHIQFGFYIGSQLRDPQEILQGNGKFVRHIKIFSNEDIDKKVFKNLIKQVV